MALPRSTPVRPTLPVVRPTLPVKTSTTLPVKTTTTLPVKTVKTNTSESVSIEVDIVTVPRAAARAFGIFALQYFGLLALFVYLASQDLATPLTIAFAATNGLKGIFALTTAWTRVESRVLLTYLSVSFLINLGYGALLILATALASFTSESLVDQILADVSFGVVYFFIIVDVCSSTVRIDTYLQKQYTHHPIVCS